MPIGPPFHMPAPKSGWTWPFTPIDATNAADWGCTGSALMSLCHHESAGNIGQLGAPGTELASAGGVPSAPRAAAASGQGGAAGAEGRRVAGRLGGGRARGAGGGEAVAPPQRIERAERHAGDGAHDLPAF